MSCFIIRRKKKLSKKKEKKSNFILKNSYMKWLRDMKEEEKEVIIKV
jgi:hypothetical protein